MINHLIKGINNAGLGTQPRILGIYSLAPALQYRGNRKATCPLCSLIRYTLSLNRGSSAFACPEKHRRIGKNQKIHNSKTKL